MKAFSFLVSFVAVFLVSTAAVADDFAVVLGARSNTADLDLAGTSSVGTKTGMAAGVIGLFDMSEKFQGRVGFLYNQRNFTVTSAAGANTDINLAYVDVPVTGVYRFADYAGIFAGPVLSLLASKEIKNSTGTGSFTKSPESMSFGMQFGATFKFAPQFGGELYYEVIPGSFAPDYLKGAKTVGANLLITFE